MHVAAKIQKNGDILETAEKMMKKMANYFMIIK